MTGVGMRHYTAYGRMLPEGQQHTCQAAVVGRGAEHHSRRRQPQGSVRGCGGQFAPEHVCRRHWCGWVDSKTESVTACEFRTLVIFGGLSGSKDLLCCVQLLLKIPMLWTLGLVKPRCSFGRPLR